MKTGFRHRKLHKFQTLGGNCVSSAKFGKRVKGKKITEKSVRQYYGSDTCKVCSIIPDRKKHMKLAPEHVYSYTKVEMQIISTFL
jgi:hypothetical protein